MKKLAVCVALSGLLVGCRCQTKMIEVPDGRCKVASISSSDGVTARETRLWVDSDTKITIPVKMLRASCKTSEAAGFRG